MQRGRAICLSVFMFVIMLKMNYAHLLQPQLTRSLLALTTPNIHCAAILECDVTIEKYVICRLYILFAHAQSDK